MEWLSVRARARKRRLWKFAKVVLTAALVVGPVTLLTLWLMFQHKPGWYHPSVLDEAGLDRAHRDAVAMTDWVSDRMAEGQPFDVVLIDRSINRWLAALPSAMGQSTAWSDLRDAWPSGVTEPAMRFQRHRVWIGVHVERGGWRAIMSGRLSLRITDDGTKVRIGLERAYGGSLPLPTSIMDDLFGDPAPIAAPRRVHALRRLVRGGLEIANRFVWFNGDRPFRIGSIRIEESTLHLHIEPQ